MAGVLVLVWGIYYCLSVMHPAQAREWLWRRKLLSTHLERYTRQSCPAHIHLLQGLEPPIFTATPPRYFPSCFPLAFLEGRYISLSSAAISLHLDPAIWDPLAPSNRAASSSSTLSQSHWRYSIILLFLFSSSTALYLSASSWAFSSASLLAFWAVHSAQRNFTASSSWTRSHYSSLCLCCISCCCFSRISVLFCEMSEGAEEDIMIQKQEQKTSFSVYVLLT